MHSLICTSLCCQNYNCFYCQKCSHANYKGFGFDKNNKFYRFTFNPQFGPLFLKSDWYLALKRQPSDTSLAWEVFDRWYDKYQYYHMWRTS